MNSASSSGVFGEEKELETKEYIDSSTKSNPDIEAATEAQQNSSIVDQQGTSENNEADNIVYPPPPDGGFLAWSQAIFAHLVVFNCWGYIQSFGVFQSYFTTVLPESPSTISWIGSLQIFLLFSVGMFSGRALDAGIFKPMFFLGLGLQLLGIFTTSIMPLKFWHIILSQSLAQGIGNGLQFCPTVALLSTYFARHRSLAIGIAASGSSMGGLIYPSIVRSLLPRLGFAWTVRVCGLVMLVVGMVAGLGLRTRKGMPARKSGPVVEVRAFREPAYALFCAGAFAVFFGLFFAFYYVASFARDEVGLSAGEGFELLMAMNAAGFVFRLLPALLADRFTGPLNFMLPFAFGTALLTYVWAAVRSAQGTWAWAVCYGLIAAGIQGLFPAVLSSLTTDLTKQGARMGMGFAVVGVASALGPPVAGAIIQASGGRYVGAQMWAGTSILIGAVILLAARTVQVGWKLERI